MNRKINTEVAGGILGLLIAVVFYLGIGDVNWMSIIFPKTIIYITMLISAGLIVKGAVRLSSRSRIFDEGSNTRWMVTGVLFFSWVLLMPTLGFFVSTTVFITLIVSYLAKSRVRLTVGRYLVWMPVILAEVTFFYLIFSKVLHVPLPEGLFF